MTEHPVPITCDAVAERVALGEPLAELDAHARDCARCRRLVALPVELAAVGRADPGAGFAARLTVGAQHRLVVRRRRRLASGLAAAVAVGVLGVFVATHQSTNPELARTTASEPPAPATSLRPQPAPTDPADRNDPWDDTNPDRKIDPDVRELVRLARDARTPDHSARWARIQKPLAPYRALVKGITP